MIGSPKAYDFLSVDSRSCNWAAGWCAGKLLGKTNTKQIISEEKCVTLIWFHPLLEKRAVYGVA